MFALISPTAPPKVADLISSVNELFAAFAKDGPTAEEMETARKQFANTFDEQMRDPSFWADALRTIDYRGRTLQSVMDAPAAYQAFTADQVRDAFNRYYKPDRTFTLSISPAPEGEKKPETAPEPSAEK